MIRVGDIIPDIKTMHKDSAATNWYSTHELFKDKRIAKIMLKIEKLEILKQCSSVGIQITKKRSHDKL